MAVNEIRVTKKNNFFRNLMVFLMVLGPGIITGSVDNDVGGITTYSLAGAHFGYKLIWTLIPAFVVLFITQEMNARMGIVTGKGLADLIRENTGVRVTFFIFMFLLVADIMNTTTEFSGVAGSMQIFGISKYISVPLVAVGLWFIVVKGNYRRTEKIFLIFSLCLLIYVVAALLGKPDWNAIGNSIRKPDFEMNFSYISTVIALIGTTIAPWMQFYMQSAVIEKKLTIRDLKFSVADVFVGCVATIVVAFFIVVACASTLYVNGTQIKDASDAAAALAPLAGPVASQVFAFGLFIASIFASVILPVAAAFYVCEAFGFEAGIDKRWDEAPQFYWLYTIIVMIAVAIVLIPDAPLIAISFWSQNLNGILLPVVMILMVYIINKKDVMGKYTNNIVTNILSYFTIAILIGLTGLQLIQMAKGI